MSELIKREDAINAVEMFFEDAFIEDADVHCTDMVYEINHIPAAPRWHRVEEELPTEKGPYITAYDDGYVGENEWHFIGIGETAVGWLYDADAVRYWMPMPTPPKEEEHGN